MMALLWERIAILFRFNSCSYYFERSSDYNNFFLEKIEHVQNLEANN